MSDKAIDDKLCVAKSSTYDTGAGACRNNTHSSGNQKGLSLVFGNSSDAAKWPDGVGSDSSKGKNVDNVTADLMALTKDEKVKVAEHRDVFSSYNRDSKM